MDYYVDLDILQYMVTNERSTLREMVDRKPVMLIFLRHFGCIFCKESLDNLSKGIRARMESKGVSPVFVHMSTFEIADKYFTQFNLHPAIHVSDPECRYYRHFGLMKASTSQLFGLQNFIRGVNNQFLKGYKPELSASLGDHNQMPGVFLIKDGIIKDAYIHRMSSDQPDYDKLLECCEI